MPSVITTCVVCVNFIHKWLKLQFKETLHGNFNLFSGFSPEIWWEEIAEEIFGASRPISQYSTYWIMTYKRFNTWNKTHNIQGQGNMLLSSRLLVIVLKKPFEIQVYSVPIFRIHSPILHHEKFILRSNHFIKFTSKVPVVY